MPRYAVYYPKNPIFAATPNPTIAGVKGIGWAKVKEIEQPDLDAVFTHMQGEFWSPNGEARPLIQKLGLHHTSMSVGDVIHDLDQDRWWLCASLGWTELNE